MYKDLTISQLATIIKTDWRKPYFGAVPYLDAMKSITNIEDDYFHESGHMIVRYFLGNAQTWKGTTARDIKKELNKRLN